MSSTLLTYAGGENTTYFLEACSFCSKPLGHNSDIYMYRGNKPFCSQECRQEQIDIDEKREKRWRVSRKTKETNKKSATDNKNNVQTGTLVVA
uniref:FCS-Like Zinc finger 3-like n=1 Tax=Erigeron canadensis TaxID=72917 RepID=UPI001CB9C211|nr:FCS-Like Zinc finger 3-like [Erigeron canadensis]